MQIGILIGSMGRVAALQCPLRVSAALSAKMGRVQREPQRRNEEGDAASPMKSDPLDVQTRGFLTLPDTLTLWQNSMTCFPVSGRRFPVEKSRTSFKSDSATVLFPIDSFNKWTAFLMVRPSKFKRLKSLYSDAERESSPHLPS